MSCLSFSLEYALFFHFRKIFIDVAGIESPGLTSAPAIGEYVARIVKNIYPAERKTDFIDSRKGIPSMALATEEE